MELKVGDYVRTKGGNIFKIIGGNTDNWEVDISCIQLEQTEENWYESNRYNDNGYWFNEENIIKSSPNIIDLIQEGDYVNGMYIAEIKSLKNNIMICMVDSDYEFTTTITNDEIERILTKEQFESMEYKVGDKENENNR